MNFCEPVGNATMAATKRAWKLQEFVAHAGNVNCLALGHKSGRVIVTGGDDKKVNLWLVGKPTCIMSLSGHTTPVECVRFGGTEDSMVIAGSMSGALKIWDLEAAKIVRTLTGHKANIRSLDFHPFGHFIASGSMDTNVKLWDIRRKGCIFTYKGHSDTVRCLRFSPDGRWLASAADDSLVKIWDLSAGKLLTEFREHSGSVSCVEFHPNEFLLASGSTDRTVKFWDLETFKCVSSSDGDSGQIRTLSFNPDGTAIFASCVDVLKIYGWEPSRCYDSIALGWGKVVDTAIAQNQLIGASFNQTNVMVYVVDLKRCYPVTQSQPSTVSTTNDVNTKVPVTASVSSSEPVPIPHHRKHYSERPPTHSSSKNDVKTDPEEDSSTPVTDGDEDDKDVQFTISDDYRDVFQPRTSTLSRTPPKTVEPFTAPPEDIPGERITPVVAAAIPSIKKLEPAHVKKSDSAASLPDKERKIKEKSTVKRSTSSSYLYRPQSPEKEKKTIAARQESTGKNPEVIPAPSDRPVGLNMCDFLPKQISSGAKPSRSVSEEESITALMSGHNSMAAVLSTRQKNLQVVRTMWTNRDIKTALDTAITMSDQAVVVDILGIICLRESWWNLDLCGLILSQLQDLLESKYENYVIRGCNALKLILKNFGSIIMSNLAGGSAIGIDISREERHNKCKICYEYLTNIRPVLEKKAKTGKLHNRFKDLIILLDSLGL